MKFAKFSAICCFLGSCLGLSSTSAEEYWPGYGNEYGSGYECGVPQCCNFSLLPVNLYIGHTEGEGIGYHQGYTSFGLFDVPTIPCSGNMRYFLDVRAHVFNNGDPAANVGIGARYLDLNREKVFGLNTYYDYRQIHDKGFHQIGLGAEVLGRCWDFRINGYIPIVTHHVDYGHVLFFYPGGYFASGKQRRRVMAGFDAELGMPIMERYSSCDAFGLYAAAGTYYFTPRIYSSFGENAWGFKARVAAQFWDYVELEARTTYDRVFHWRGEGCITISYPFGGSCCEESCNCLDPLARQRVRRQEMIVVDHPCCVWDVNFDGFTSIESSDDSCHSRGRRDDSSSHSISSGSFVPFGGCSSGSGSN